MSFKVRNGKIQHIFCINPASDAEIPWEYMENLSKYLYNLASWWTYDIENNRYIVILEGSVCSMLTFRNLLVDNFDLELTKY
jgi:hypothetical protein